MSILYGIFKLVSDLPIGDPHAGYEGELLACGGKPIGFLTSEMISADRDAREYFLPGVQKQIKIADKAVADGRIVKRLIEAKGAPDVWPGIIIRGHFYCQPQFVDDMNELADGYETYWTTGKFPKLSQEVGYFIGCTDTDFAHPRSGLMYDFLNATSPIRRYCRAQTLKHEASTGTIQLRTRLDHQ